MRSFRRLPPFVRALRVVWVLAFAAAVGVWVWNYLATRGADQSGASRGWTRGSAIWFSLFLLGLACNTVLLAYNARFARHPARWASWTDAWQTQLKVTLALTALPLCSLVGALLIPSRSSLFQVVFALQVLSALLLMGGFVWASRYYG